MANTKEIEKNYTPKEVAELMQVSRQTVYNWVTAGRVKAFKIGNNLRITESEVKKLQSPIKK